MKPLIPTATHDQQEAPARSFCYRRPFRLRLTSASGRLPRHRVSDQAGSIRSHHAGVLRQPAPRAHLRSPSGSPTENQDAGGARPATTGSADRIGDRRNDSRSGLGGRADGAPGEGGLTGRGADSLYAAGSIIFGSRTVCLRPRTRSPRPHDQTRASRRALPDLRMPLSVLRRGDTAPVTPEREAGRPITAGRSKRSRGRQWCRRPSCAPQAHPRMQRGAPVARNPAI